MHYCWKTILAIIRWALIVCLLYIQSQIWSAPSIKVKRIKALPLEKFRQNKFREYVEKTLANLARLRKIIKDKRNARRPQPRKTKTLRRLEKKRIKEEKRRRKTDSILAALTGLLMKALNTLITVLWSLLWSPAKKKSEELYPLKARPTTNKPKGTNFDI